MNGVKSRGSECPEKFFLVRGAVCFTKECNHSLKTPEKGRRKESSKHLLKRNDHWGGGRSKQRKRENTGHRVRRLVKTRKPSLS